MDQKALHIGIISYEDYKKRSLAIACGEYRPQPDEPKIWFSGMDQAAPPERKRSFTGGMVWD